MGIIMNNLDELNKLKLYKKLDIVMDRMKNLSAMINASYHPFSIELIKKWLDETLESMEKDE